MARDQVTERRFRGVSRVKDNHPGRPRMCQNIPGKGACLKQLKSSRPRICRNCLAPEILTVWIKVFGR